ncbi:MAG: DUF364 domain-containing protein [Thalassobaculaceae bacterium]|nr:DUF364 domain-containing protein [Thalassobaculaceae bacterium]
MANGLLEPVIAGTDDGVADRVVVGFNWTALQCGPAVGLAWSPRAMDGARSTPETGTYAGRPLRDLARLVSSDNPYERSIGLAAANAFWNRPSTAIGDGDGLTPWATDFDALGQELRRTVVIGRFPGLDAKFPGATIVELQPRPGEIAFTDADSHLRTAIHVVVTGSTLVNGTADRIVDSVSAETKITLVGPSVPLCPGLLRRPVARLAGFIVTDPDRAFAAVMEGAGAKALKRYGRAVVMAPT